jgi:hypothetical protein
LFLVFFALYPFILAGCDTISGVNRRALVSKIPSVACVDHMLKKVDGICAIRHEVKEGGRPLTLTGIKPPNALHYFFYKVHGLNGYFYFDQNFEGKIEFNQGYTYINAIPPQEEMDLILPVMKQIELLLESECNLELNIVEHCMLVECK